MWKRYVVLLILAVAVAVVVVVMGAVATGQDRPHEAVQTPPIPTVVHPVQQAAVNPAQPAESRDAAPASLMPPGSSSQAVEDEAAAATPAVDGQAADAAEVAQDPLDHPDNPFEYGRTPVIPSSENPQVASVAQALREGTHPERLSPVHQATAFDLLAYESDPDAFLSLIEPGRVFQSAQPGPEVPRLRALGPTQVRLRQGERVALRVQAQPGHPVSFTSFDLGIFADNMLSSITVAADAQGVAEVQLLGTPGTIGEVRILSASPTSAGQVRYIAIIERDGGSDAERRQESERHG